MGTPRAIGVVATVVFGLTLAACSDGTAGGGSTGDSNNSASTLVVDNSFDLKTSDPARAFELTGSLVDHQIYQTAIGFDGASVKKIVPVLCTYSVSDDNKVLTLKMNGKHVFSNGDPVTADDIVYSYQRVQGIEGNPSFLLDGVTVKKVDDNTITLTSASPNPQLPYILPNPSLGIVDSKIVKQNGGTTDTNDKAEAYLNKTSAGSGPYMLSSYDVTSKVVLTANPHYTGTKPHYSRVVIENVQPATAKANLQAGAAQIATSLDPTQASGMDSGKTKVQQGESTITIFSWFNMNPSVGGPVSNVKFIQAVRHAIDYDAVLKVAGSGAVQPGSLVPNSFLGALKSDSANSFDLNQAKTLLKDSGYSGQQINMLYPSDVGYNLANVAQVVQSNLQAAGINVKLNPQPSATALTAFRSGKQQAGIAYWGADYPDPADYLVFTPGQSLAKRAQWTSAQAPDDAKLATAAESAVGDSARDAAYQALWKQMNIDGPFVPLFLPPNLLVVSSSLKNVADNPVTGIDLAGIS
ncbi:peptide/nickel transport system substrate-binding protein [Branchiibius hedensis]|uniref:Peptide/nickel transport system substrate-binding protein n=1 Tax=Branchiibius hedensis TaxID=672460 RepID=A0A2Y8ZMJ1_9MICO|nr:peptide/nickel transport system substrate-binding protein [Branchiibius hedensis]SSA33510.1 peptide/nickel transport system substrate-binding protein [Branchiibius hedensis]